MCSDKLKECMVVLEEGGHHVQGYSYLDKYDCNYDTNNGTFVRKYGKPTLTCPNGYD